MNLNLNLNHVKKACPYNVKCYRKNPIHFNEMSHPHLEKLLIDQLEGTIEIPESLDFECTDRSQLLDQLKVLQMVLRKERDKAGTSGLNKNSNSESTTKNKDQSIEDLKKKAERHKQATAAKRGNKLLEMDAIAGQLLRASTSTAKTMNNDTEIDCNKLSKMRKELNDLAIAYDEEESDQSRKRVHDTLNDNLDAVKKTKPNENTNLSEKKQEKNNTQTNKQSQSTSSESSNSSNSQESSSKGTSIMDLYKSCNSEKSRDEVRRKAIHMMRKQGYDVSVVEPGEFALKYALSAPYHLFYTRIQKSKETYAQQYSITFPEILDRSLGEIVSSLHINFMVDVGWLCLQYLLAGQRTDMLILYGDRVDEEKLGLNITMILVPMPSKFGCHHSKIMILRYKDNGIRVVVSTSNLYSDDWENRTQGLWISPHLPQLPESANPSDGESPTKFKEDLERYLTKYRQAVLTEWIYAVRRADFSSVNVFFVASVPGSHKDREFDSWGHRKVANVLSKHAVLPPNAPEWPVVAQSSSIGSLGPNYESWLLKEIVPSMSREVNEGLKSHPKFHFIYPSLNNYKQSFDCRNGSCCLPYTMQTHSKQTWLESYLHQWKAIKTGRDKAMPHIKSYTRLSPDLSKIPWFVLTSANLSKAAWGTARNSNYIMSYEAGVIFIPKFITKTTIFPIKEETAGVPVFPIPYDLPLTRYDDGDKPFVMEFFEGYE